MRLDLHRETDLIAPIQLCQPRPTFHQNLIKKLSLCSPRLNRKLERKVFNRVIKGELLSLKIKKT